MRDIQCRREKGWPIEQGAGGAGGNGEGWLCKKDGCLHL